MATRQEGQGFSITVGGVAHAARLISLTLPSRAREMIETTHQGTASDKEFVGSVLRDPGEWVFVHELDTSLDPEGDYYEDGAEHTWRVTLPLRTGESTAGYFEFTGTVSDLSYGEAAPAAMIRPTVTVKQSGALTYTAPV